MGKKIFSIVFVIIFGFMIGFIILKSISQDKNITTDKTSNIPSNSQDITASLSVNPKIIKSAGEENDYSKVDKSLIEISYESKSEELKDVKIYLYIQGGGKYELDPMTGATIDQEETKSKSVTVIKSPAAKAGETKKVGIYLLSREKGEASISADIKADEKTKRTNVVGLIVE